MDRSLDIDRRGTAGSVGRRGGEGSAVRWRRPHGSVVSPLRAKRDRGKRGLEQVEQFDDVVEVKPPVAVEVVRVDVVLDGRALELFEQGDHVGVVDPAVRVGTAASKSGPSEVPTAPTPASPTVPRPGRTLRRDARLNLLLLASFGSWLLIGGSNPIAWLTVRKDDAARYNILEVIGIVASTRFDWSGRPSDRRMPNRRWGIGEADASRSVHLAVKANGSLTGKEHRSRLGEAKGRI